MFMDYVFKVTWILPDLTGKVIKKNKKEGECAASECIKNLL